MESRPSLSDLGLTQKDTKISPQPVYIPGESFVARKERESKRKRFHIYSIAQQHGLGMEFLPTEQGSLLLLKDDASFRLNPTILEVILTEQHATEEKDMGNECYRVAEDAVKKNVATGRLSSPDGNENFVTYSNHCINYRALDDGSLLAFDLSAGRNIDQGRNYFKVLAVRSDNMDELKGLVKELYGGDPWIEMPIQEKE